MYTQTCRLTLSLTHTQSVGPLLRDSKSFTPVRPLKEETERHTQSVLQSQLSERLWWCASPLLVNPTHYLNFTLVSFWAESIQICLFV